MATEVPSCDVADDVADDGSVRVSVVRFIRENNNEEKVEKLYTEWLTLLNDHRMTDPSCIREPMDDWFVKVYSKREEVHRMETDQLHSLKNDTEAMMYEEFTEQIHAKLNSPDNSTNKFERLKLQTAFTDIEHNFPGMEWVKNAINCMEAERKLIQKYSEVSVATTNEQDRKIEEQMSYCGTLNEEVDCQYICCAQEYKALCKSSTELDNQKQVLDDLTFVIEAGTSRNGFTPDKKAQIESQVEKMSETVQQKNQTVTNKLFELIEKLKHTVEGYRVLTAMVTREIKEWQRQFQFNYAQIYAKPNLERIAPWCEKTGQMLDKLQTLFLNTRNLFESVGWVWNEHGQVYEADLMSILQAFFQSSFVVVEQDDFVIKVDKKNFPKISVRLLAAEGLGLAGCKVHAHFVYEDHLQLRADDVDLVHMKKNERKIIGGEVVYTDKGKNKGSNFSGMNFKAKKDFNREDTTNQMVHDEKYRLIFLTEFKGQQYWTLSLPLVVTTGANQGCRALASIMWQCFSTNVYQVPVEKKEELPWCEVAKMVDQKMLRLSPKRRLSEENLAHLKTRLFGRSDVPDEEMVTLKRFCFDKMFKTENEDSQCGFSFWKWFLANYNLVDRYLKDYWDKGLIEGFISKDDCKQKFTSCRSHKSGMFILRFSDQHITDSQGVKNMFGHLTSAVCNTVMENDEKKKKIVFLDVGGHSKLKEKNLANLLAESQDKHQKPVYRTLFPGRVQRQEAFDSYCQEGTIVDGYVGPRDAFIVDLEHAVCALSLSTGKHRSPSVDSGFDAGSPASARSRGHGGKRLRSIEENHPTITHMLSRRPGDSPASVDTAPHLSTPQPSPAFSVPSPATEVRVPSHMNDVPLLTGTPGSSPAYAMQSPAELEAEIRNNIPKTVEDFQSDVPSTNHIMSHNGTNVPQVTASQVGSGAETWVNTGSFAYGHSPQQVEQIDPDSNSEVVIIYNPEPNQQQVPACSQSATVNQMLTGQETAVAANQITHLMALCQNRPDLVAVEQWFQNMPPEMPEPVRQAMFQALQPRGDVSSPGPVQTATDNMPEDIQMMNSSSSGSMFHNLDPTMIAEAQQMDSGSIDCTVFDDQSF